MAPRSTRLALDAFDPNTAAPYATFIPTRSQKFKVQANRKTALSAISQYQAGLLYGYQDGRWVELARKCREDHEERCQRCGGSTVGIDRCGLYGQRSQEADLGQFEWKREKGKIVDPPVLLFLCQKCRALP